MITLTITGLPSAAEIGDLVQFNTLCSRALYNRGMRAVLRFTDRFSAVLERGAPEDVGASGKAAKNFANQFSDTKGGGEWILYEGGYTGANNLIRTGIKPGSKVPIDKLRNWAADKGVKLYYDMEKYQGNQQRHSARRQRPQPNAVLDRMISQKGTLFTRSRWFGASGLRAKSSMKPSQVATKGLYALRYALFKEGTKRPTADWYPLRPAGYGRFNYPVYVWDKDKAIIKDILDDLGDGVADDIAEGLF